MAQKADQPLSTPTDEPAWKQRAVERSTQGAKRRAEQRVGRFLDAAQAIMAEKGTTDFTVQEVVDRSKQSLRSFYQHFDGKHQLLLALFEDAMSKSAEQLRATAAEQSSPLDRLKAAVQTPVRELLPRPGGQAPALHRIRPAPARLAPPTRCGPPTPRSSPCSPT